MYLTTFSLKDFRRFRTSLPHLTVKNDSRGRTKKCSVMCHTSDKLDTQTHCLEILQLPHKPMGTLRQYFLNRVERPTLLFSYTWATAVALVFLELLCMLQQLGWGEAMLGPSVLYQWSTPTRLWTAGCLLLCLHSLSLQSFPCFLQTHLCRMQQSIPFLHCCGQCERT